MPGKCQTRFSVCKEIWKRSQWSFIGPGSEEEVVLTIAVISCGPSKHGGAWDNMAERGLVL